MTEYEFNLLVTTILALCVVGVVVWWGVLFTFYAPRFLFEGKGNLQKPTAPPAAVAATPTSGGAP